MDDTISRQAVIDAIGKHIDTFDAIDTNYLCGLRTAMSFLKEMPSAQPSDEYDRGWEEGREALREETWEYDRDRLD